MHPSPVAFGKRAVRDLADEPLDEPVLPAFGRSGICLEREHLATDERRSRGTRSSGWTPLTAARASRVNVLPMTDAPWSSDRSAGSSPSRRDAISAWSDAGTDNWERSPVGR